MNPTGPTLPRSCCCLPWTRSGASRTAWASSWGTAYRGCPGRAGARGRITEEQGRVRVVNPLEPSDPLLAVFLRTLPTPDRSRFGSGTVAKHWVRQTGRGPRSCIWTPWWSAASCAGDPPVSGPAALPPPPHRPRGPLGAGTGAFRGGRGRGLPDRRNVLLAALVSAAGLSSSVVRGGWRTHSAMRASAREEWPALAVHRNVHQDATAGRSRVGFGGGRSGSGDD
ncbi:GPP34 family phosphoprotein [Streptomyces sp. M10(2022)]